MSWVSLVRRTWDDGVYLKQSLISQNQLTSKRRSWIQSDNKHLWMMFNGFTYTNLSPMEVATVVQSRRDSAAIGN